MKAMTSANISIVTVQRFSDLLENKENSASYSALEPASISMDYILYLQTHFKYMHVDMLALSPAKHAWWHRIRGNKKSFCSFKRVSSAVAKWNIRYSSIPQYKLTV